MSVGLYKCKKMRNIKLRKIVVLLLVLALALCPLACRVVDGESGGEIKIELLSPSDGEVVLLNHPEVQGLLESGEESEIAKILWKNHLAGIMRLDSQFVFLNWAYKGGVNYTVTIATDPSLSKVVQIIESNVQNAEIGCLLPKTKYYWQVKSDDGVKSKIGIFTTSDKSCFLEVEGVDNFRDIGGYKTETGKTVKFGALYRSARLENATEAGIKVMTELLGVKSEIDLRLEKEMSAGFSFKEIGNYLNVTFDGYTSIIPQSGNFDGRVRVAFKQIFEFLSNESNYPVVFHCSAGADRTGTLAYLISGVLGVSYFELAKDYELTSFSNQGNRWRDNIIETPFGYMFDGSGIMEYGNITASFGKMHNLMMENYVVADGTLSSAIENYLIKECEVTKEQIDNFRNIMLEH